LAGIPIVAALVGLSVVAADSPEIREAGSEKVVLPIEDSNGPPAVALSMDFMNASKQVIVAATGSGCASAVATAFTDGATQNFGCPAGMVHAARTRWFLDAGSRASYQAPA